MISLNLGINSIELTLMTLIELSQLDHSLQNYDNLICIGLVNWIDDLESILISNLFYTLFVQFCLYSATKILFQFRFRISVMCFYISF